MSDKLQLVVVITNELSKPEGPFKRDGDKLKFIGHFRTETATQMNMRQDKGNCRYEG
jgi:hypothetical protein